MFRQVTLPFGGRLLLDDVEARAFCREASSVYGVRLNTRLLEDLTPGCGRRVRA